MGEVWLANDEQLADRPVAIKIMHQHMLPNEGDVARFEREMRFAAIPVHREFPLRIAEGHPHGQSHAERVGVKHAGRGGGP
jgi:hypothetical protein